VNSPVPPPFFATKKQVLVIKLGALGDFVQAFGPFAAIRARHSEAHITLLTAQPFASLARRSPWFDAVDDNGRPGWRDLAALWRLRRLLGSGFGHVYDLQTSARSSRYRWLVGRRAAWSGVDSHRRANPNRDAMHTADRQREQLRLDGITHFPPPALDWLDADVTRLGLPEAFALLIPGASPARPAKRWPIECFAALSLPVPAVVVGGPAEATLAAAIPGAIDLTGRTDLPTLAAIARRATVAIGNDTGPTHLVAVAGTPTVALFGDDSDPALCAPRGAAVTVLRQRPLADLPVETVRAAALALTSAATRVGEPP